MTAAFVPDIAYLTSDVDENVVISRLRKNRGRYIVWPGSENATLETGRRLRWLIRSGGLLKDLDEPVTVVATKGTGVKLRLCEDPDNTTVMRISPEAAAVHDKIGGREVIEGLRAEYDQLGSGRSGKDAEAKKVYWTKVAKLLDKSGVSPYTLSRDMGLATHTVIHALQRNGLA